MKSFKDGRSQQHMIGPLKVVRVEEPVQYDCMYLIAQNIRRGNRPNGGWGEGFAEG